MTIKFILNGGVKSCCSVYPTTMVRSALESWFEQKKDIQIEVIDKTVTNYQLDKLASLAQNHFGDNIYPLVYFDNVLAAVGSIPARDTLFTMVDNVDKIGINEQDILDAAKKAKANAEK